MSVLGLYVLPFYMKVYHWQSVVVVIHTLLFHYLLCLTLYYVYFSQVRKV